MFCFFLLFHSQVTVNSGGVVFFALFNHSSSEDASRKEEAAAVIKFSSSRMATQSERLGYEFAKWLGVQIPQVLLFFAVLTKLQYWFAQFTFFLFFTTCVNE